jgi:two-component system chemotaxis response regulator CheB
LYEIRRTAVAISKDYGMSTIIKPIRVLVVEDSPTFRELLIVILQSTPGLQVVGTARNGLEAIRLARRLKPDVITMDVHMPEMDGFEATRQIMEEMPRPIVIISASHNSNERDLTFSALQAGALSVLEKPTVNDPPEIYHRLANQVRLMSEVKVVRRWAARPAPAIPVEPAAIRKNGKTQMQIVVIASSTGGPGTLAEVLRPLPASFPAPILVVQHITPGFGEGLAAWLNQQVALQVRLAQHTDEPKPGEVLIAPDNYHMEITNMGLIALSKTPPYQGLRPSANVLFHSVAQAYGSTALGIILTGMGNDGAEGLRAMYEAGAHTIAQDKDTCIVFGMPAAAIELGVARQVLPAGKIPAAMMALI